MKRTPLVSVVVTAYNSAQYICDTLNSVYAQTYKNFEVIVADDGSTDQTRHLVTERFPKVRYVYKPNGGQPTARNLGINNANGALIAFVDSDDLWLPTKLEKQVSVFQDNNSAMWCYCDCQNIEESPEIPGNRFSQDSKPYSGEVLEHLFLHNFIPSPTIIIRREVFDIIGLWDETVQRAEDWNMWLRIAAQYPIHYVDQVLALYRRHAGSKRATTTLDTYLQAHLRVHHNALACNHDRLEHLRKTALSRIYYKLALTSIKNNARTHGLRYAVQSLLLQPFNIKSYSLLLMSVSPSILIDFAIRIRSRRRIGLSENATNASSE